MDRPSLSFGYGEAIPCWDAGSVVMDAWGLGVSIPVCLQMMNIMILKRFHSLKVNFLFGQIAGLVLGKAKDAQWKKFTSKIVKATDTPVLPVFFHCQNSRLFQIIGNFHLNLKPPMFFHEICSMIGEKVYLTIGRIVNCADYGSVMNDKVLIEFPYRQTKQLTKAEFYITDEPFFICIDPH
jgi:hypothetical protein